MPIPSEKCNPVTIAPLSLLPQQATLFDRTASTQALLALLELWSELSWLFHPLSINRDSPLVQS